MSSRSALFDSLPCAALLTDGAGRVLQVNAELKALAGEPEAGWGAHRIDDMLVPAARIFLQTHVWPMLLHHGRVDEIHLKLLNAQGQQIPVLLNATRSQSADQPGDMRFVWALFAAVERQRFEWELLRARERLQNLVRSTNAGTWEWNVLTGELKVNERWAAILGWRLAELGKVDQAFRLSLAHPDEAARTQELLQAHLAGQDPEYVHQVRLRRSDGSWAWVQDRGRVVSHTSDGKPEWMFGTLIDIGDVMEQKAALRRSEELLSRTNELAGVGGWELDLRTQALFWSEQTCRIHGVPVGYRPSLQEALSFYPPPARSLLEEAVQAGITAGKGWDLELPFVRRDGARLMVRAMGSAQSERGVTVRLVGAFQDVTAHNRLMAALEHAKAAAEAASAAKSMFLANMSHEIRTPMNAVIGIAHLLADTPLNADQRQLLGKLQVAGRSLLGIINDVLDLAKIEAGELVLEHIPYRPADLLQDLGALFGDQARAKGLVWTVECAADIPRTLTGDIQRLRQTLSNLLSNAIKFTQQGGVSLRLSRIEAPDGGAPRLRYAVRDSGIGIAPEAQAQLFQPFVQAELSTTRRFGGTGLGLSIVKRLVELMGGAVSLHSTPGRGSEFAIDLPLQPALDDWAAPSAALAVLEVLVVEDDPIQRERLAALCTGFGWRAQALASAEELLAALAQRQAPGQTLPDVLLLDWQLGQGLDGLTALRQLRGEWPAARLPVTLLITQHQRKALQTEDIQRLVDAVLAKPANPSTLFNAVNEAIARYSGNSELVLSRTALGRLSAGLLPEVRLLVVDDSDINLDVARRMLERHGASVQCETQAEDALARLRSGERFDAVLMDIHMPGMDGLEATRQIRQALGLHELPVVALTAGALVEERRRAIEAGLDDFLTKPLDPEALVRTLRRHIESRRGAPLPVRAPVEDAALAADWPEIAGIAAADAAQRLGGDSALFLRLLARLIERHGAAWHDRLTQLDAAQAAAELHKLRGSAGMLGAQRVHELATEGEERLRDAAAPATLAPIYSALAQALKALEVAARPWLRPSTAPQPALPTQTQAKSTQQYAELLTLLRQQDLEAAAAFGALQPWLRQQGLSDEQIASLQCWLDDLDYEPALQLLATWRSNAPA